MTPEERKAHRAEYMRRYRETHREQMRENNRRYSHTDKGKETDRRRREKNREQHIILSRKYYQEHRDELLHKAKIRQTPRRRLAKAQQTINDMDQTIQAWLKEFNALFT